MNNRQKEMIVAIMSNDIDKIEYLFDHGLDVNMKLKHDGAESPLLAFAILMGKKKSALKLIAAGADLNAQFKDKNGNPCDLLTVCVVNPKKEIIEALLKGGCDVNKIVPPAEKSAFPYPIRAWHLFALCAQKDVLELLLERCENLDIEAKKEINFRDVLHRNTGISLHTFLHKREHHFPTILELLRPDAKIQKTYQKALKKMNGDFAKAFKSKKKKAAYEIGFAFAEAYKSGKEAERNGDLLGMEHAMDNFSIKAQQNGSSFGRDMAEGLLEIHSMDNGFTAKSLNATLLPAYALMKNFEDLYNGGNDKHKEIASMIEHRLMAGNQVTHKKLA